jgi:hypothetical protein
MIADLDLDDDDDLDPLRTSLSLSSSPPASSPPTSPISPPPTTLLTGLLQLDGGVAISSTPVYVADQTNTDSKLALSTTSVNVNTLTGSALVNIKGTGTTSSSNSLVVQNSAGTNVIQALDNTNIYFGKAIKYQQANPKILRLTLSGLSSSLFSDQSMAVFFHCHIFPQH